MLRGTACSGGAVRLPTLVAVLDHQQMIVAQLLKQARAKHRPIDVAAVDGERGAQAAT